MFARNGKFMKASLVLLLVLPAIAGCGGITDVKDTKDGPEVAQLALEPGTATLFVGQMVQIRVAAGPDGTRPSLGPPTTWASTNPVVASVSGGLVRGVAPGSATITMSGPAGRGRAAIIVR